MMMNVFHFRAEATKNIAAVSPKVPTVLTIAGSDSGSGAGIQADIKACAALGVYCCSAITALTAQNTFGVQGIMYVPHAFVKKQIESVLADIKADVVKTGMMGSADIVNAVCQSIKSHSIRALVVDPVMVATSGDQLSNPAVLDAIRKNLLPLAEIVTPNLSEASALVEGPTVDNLSDMKETAAKIHLMGPRNVLVKGGHLSNTDDVVDVLYDGNQWHELRERRILTSNTHGTGCTLAAAIAAELAKGNQLLPAVLKAKQYVTAALKHSTRLGIGQGRQGPMNHVFDFINWESRPYFNPKSLFLYAVTDSGMNRRWGRSTSDAVLQAIQGGATIIQIREKEADTLEFMKEAEASLAVARGYDVPLLINDRVDVALACDADGVHLGQCDMPASKARAILGVNKIIGVSCKTVEQAVRAWKEGADYIGCGGVYPTNTKKKNKTIGLSGLQAICDGSPLPVVAIGGISEANVGEVMKLRAKNLYGVAIVSALFDQPNLFRATKDFEAVLTSLYHDMTIM